MVPEPVRVHVAVALGVGPEAPRHLIVVIATDAVAVADKVNGTLLDGQSQGAVIAHFQRTLDAILGADSFDHRGDFCFLFLTHVRHVFLLFVYCKFIL